MALAFPRVMPRTRINQQSFELRRVDFTSPRTDGRITGVTVGTPLWGADWTFGEMSEADTEMWRAWLSSLRGPQRHFYGADLHRRVPRAYRSVGLPVGFNGDAATWSVNSDRDVLTLGFTTALTLLDGDYIGFRWGVSRRTKVRCLESETGTSVAISIEPPLPTVVSAGAIAYVKDPVCLMRLMPEQPSLGTTPERSLRGGFRAVQELLP